MFERCLYFNINALARTINQRWEQAYRAHSLSPAHAYLLRLVLNTPGITQKQLAAELHLAPSTVTRFIDSLAERGLLRRQTSAGDAREWAIHPGDEARALQTDLEQTGEQLFQELQAALGTTNLTNLVKDLRNVHQTLHHSTRRTRNST